MTDMTAAGVASTQAFKRIQEMEAVLNKLMSDGAPLREPPGVPFMPYMRAAGSTTEAGPHFTPPTPPRANYRQIADQDKLFDDKAATSPVHSYGGDSNEGVKWHRTLRGYFTSRNKVLSPILDFVEKHELKEVTLAAMEQESLAQGWMIEDLERLSEVLWGFLNTCLKGPAKDSFDAADDLDGFNAWRIVVQ